MSSKSQELKKDINNTAESTKDTVEKASDTVQNGFDKATKSAQEEVVRLRRELDDLKANPKVKKAEAYLTSPASYGFYQGLLVGAGLVILYSKFIAPNNKLL
ncbi:hypothetical protein BCR42DRAFT_402889 [Absidia repens]|uniref:DUF883 domain-containing protein n=1 Tax=Absidia repens TaxID=90262 RepID=A0A1X2IYP3_9FUNG|nr:hypothetical protein BCR42DRAFT_402889 [Absidia repens]